MRNDAKFFLHSFLVPFYKILVDKSVAVRSFLGTENLCNHDSLSGRFHSITYFIFFNKIKPHFFSMGNCTIVITQCTIAETWQNVPIETGLRMAGNRKGVLRERKLIASKKLSQ